MVVKLSQDVTAFEVPRAYFTTQGVSPRRDVDYNIGRCIHQGHRVECKRGTVVHGYRRQLYIT
jgi:hypothetical protein